MNKMSVLRGKITGGFLIMSTLVGYLTSSRHSEEWQTAQATAREKLGTSLITYNPKPEVKVEKPVYDRFHKSPDYRARKGKNVDISEIVLHTTEGSGSGAERWLTTKDKTLASAHYLIMEDGEIVGLVKEKDAAYQCRGHNDNSVGIEFAGHYDKDLNPSQIKSGQKVIRHLMQNYKISKDNIRAHSDLDPSRRKDPGKKNMEAILKGIK